MNCGTIVHFGFDQCSRVPVLRDAGYDVAICDSLPQFKSIVQVTPADAVLMAESTRQTDHIATTIRQFSPAPLIFFAPTIQEYPERLRSFDLVIEPMVDPAEWLASVRRLIESARQTCAESAQMREQSAKLRAESAESREESARERKRSSNLRI